MLFYIAKESRVRRRFWALERRADRAARDWLAAYRPGEAPEAVRLILQTGETFIVTTKGGQIVSVEQEVA